MKVFKFGGASVKDAAAVRNVASVINLFPQDDLTVVVSAMGKTTNAMESIWRAYLDGDLAAAQGGVEERRIYHHEIMDGLDVATDAAIRRGIDTVLDRLKEKLGKPASDHRDYEYDQIVSVGEIISTKIVNHFLSESGVNSRWFDARTCIRTNNNYREGAVDWDTTTDLLKSHIGAFHAGEGRTVAVIQGFIGHTNTGHTTTLGREGSDFTGGILAWCLDGESLTIWKDVPGMLNADPKWFNNTVQLPRISYREALELAYYGATVIHPKTIKPLQNKTIPLAVKSFVNPEAEGTLIQASTASDYLIPSFIFKMKQVLISISPRDFSFIVEGNFSDIYKLFAEERVKMNLMQNSALNFSVSVDLTERVPRLLERLQERYRVKYNEGLELVTIRHYDEPTINRVTENKEILLEQKSRFTARMVMRDLG